MVRVRIRANVKVVRANACDVRQPLPQRCIGGVAVVVPIEGVEEQLHVDGVRGHAHDGQRLAQVRQRERAVRDVVVVPEREPVGEGWAEVHHTVRVASCPVPLVRTARRRLVRVARTYSTEAPGRGCQHSRERSVQVSDAREELEREVGDGRVRHAQPGRPGPRPRHQQHGATLRHSRPVLVLHEKAETCQT